MSAIEKIMSLSKESFDHSTQSDHMQFLSYNLQDYSSSDKGRSNSFLMQDILHVKTLEKPFNKPNDTPNRRENALKDRKHLISLITNKFLEKYHSLVSDTRLIDVSYLDKFHKKH